MFTALQYCMSSVSESSIFIDDSQRRRLLKGLFENYYENYAEKAVIFDTNRGWCQSLPVLGKLFPNSKVLCCVRNPAWILDSFERNFQNNAIEPSRMFNYDSKQTVYSRAELLARPQGSLGWASAGLRQAWFGEYADRLIVVRYNSLTSNPQCAIDAIYENLGLPPFAHDFNSTSYEEPAFDKLFALPGLHSVSGPIAVRTRKTILPPDLFALHNKEFWEEPNQNPRSVIII